MIIVDANSNYILPTIGILVILALAGFLIWWFLVRPLLLNQSFCKKGGCGGSNGHSMSMSSSLGTPSLTLREIITLGIDPMYPFAKDMRFVSFVLIDQQDAPFGYINFYKPSCSGYLRSIVAISPKIVHGGANPHYSQEPPVHATFTADAVQIQPFTQPYKIKITDSAGIIGNTYIVSDW